jgi:hypothetical protein
VCSEHIIIASGSKPQAKPQPINPIQKRLTADLSASRKTPSQRFSIGGVKQAARKTILNRKVAKSAKEKSKFSPQRRREHRDFTEKRF